ncbi:MAG: extracellular solute-binding protein [Chloroflexaceae bacterium]|jgi:ABC-type glycerol-3-phosphate transport system substrate-binding protein|nr:extracellular solute-binding protein [Chloroflexaceae bacterium]
MNKSRQILLATLLALFSLVVAACGSTPTAAPTAAPVAQATTAPTAAPAATTAPTAAPAATAAATAAPAATAAAEPTKPPVTAGAMTGLPRLDGQTIKLWTQYDPTKTDSDQSRLLSAQIAAFEAATGATVEAEVIAWDQLATKLALAVQSGGDVPDIIEAGSQHIPALLSANALTDLTELVKDQPWLSDMAPTDALICQVEGRRVCVSNLVRSGVTYYRVSDFPNGFPATAEEALTEAERLAGEGKFFTSFFANKEFAAAELTYGQWIYSNGGTIFDAEGRPAWANEQSVQVLEWARQMKELKALPEPIFTGDFAAAEKPWVEQQSASFRGGTWSFIFIPGMDKEVADGTVRFTGGLSFNGNKPTTFMNAETLVVPTGAKNPAGAAAWLSAFMDPGFLAQWSKASFGLPTRTAALSQGDFNNDFYRQISTFISEQGKLIEQSPYYQESLNELAIAIQDIMLNPSVDIAERLQKAQDDTIARFFR